MRNRIILAPLLALPLGGCLLESALGPAAVVGATSLVLIGKTPVDVVASLATGRNCSAVNLERRDPYCLAHPGPPEPAPFCTRTIGQVDCWTTPPPGTGRGLADAGR
jgi:hypothetical protein